MGDPDLESYFGLVRWPWQAVVAEEDGTAEGAVLVGSYMPFAWSLRLVDKPTRQ